MQSSLILAAFNTYCAFALQQLLATPRGTMVHTASCVAVGCLTVTLLCNAVVSYRLQIDEFVEAKVSENGTLFLDASRSIAPWGHTAIPVLSFVLRLRGGDHFSTESLMGQSPHLARDQSYPEDTLRFQCFSFTLRASGATVPQRNRSGESQTFYTESLMEQSPRSAREVGMM